MRNHKSVKIKTQPSIEPLTLQEVKDFIKDVSDSEDTLVEMFITASVDAAEKYTKRAFINRTMTLTLDYFDKESFYLPYPPIVSIDEIRTFDINNSSTIYDDSNYTLITDKLVLNTNAMWPTNLRDVGAVEIDYVAGYGATRTDIPSAIKIAIMNHVAVMFNNRTLTEIPEVSKSLLNGYRLLDNLGLM